MDIETLLKELRRAERYCLNDYSRMAGDAVIALSTLQDENEKLRAELEQVKRCIEIVENQRDQMKRERDAAIDCIYKIEDALDRGNDNDWAREHISEWESQKEG